MGNGGFKKMAGIISPIGTALYGIGKNLVNPKVPTPASAKKLESKAATAAEKKRLARAGAKSAGGQTKFASAPSMGMNLKNKMGQ